MSKNNNRDLQNAIVHKERRTDSYLIDLANINGYHGKARPISILLDTQKTMVKMTVEVQLTDFYLHIRMNKLIITWCIEPP